MFLVLSGFCLYFPLVRRSPIDEIKLDIKSFAKRRAWRILPPYYAAFFGFALLHIVFTHKPFHVMFYQILGGPLSLLLHVFMLFNLNARAIAVIAPSFWSIALECQLYLLFPLFVWSFGRYGLKRTLSVALLVSIAWQIFCGHQLGFAARGPMSFSVYYYALPGRCFEFALGMATAAFCARPHPKQNPVAIAVLIVLPLPALYFVLYIYMYAPFIDQVWGVIFAAALILLSRVPNALFNRSAIGRFFVWLGTISYSVYLIHQPVILILAPKMHMCVGGAADVALFPILVLLGYLFHLAVERPFMRMRKKPKQSVKEAAALNAVP
jgi:peptidoglycan/LPS O-acetylase OafA/YrhL